MQTGYLDLRHVACDAILLRDRAQFQALAAGRGQPSHRRMTSLAFSIIEGSAFLRVSVWIVAGGTRNPPVRGVIAFAVCQPVRLEPDVQNPTRTVCPNLSPRAMTPAAQNRKIFGTHFRQLRHPGAPRLAGSHFRDVSRRIAMALSAAHAGNQRFEAQLVALNGARRVAAKATARLRRVDPPAGSLVQSAPGPPCMARCPIETSQP